LKILVFLAALFVFVPIAARLASTSVVARRWVVGVMAFSVFHRISMSFFHEFYRGESSDFEVTLLDLLALALYIAQHLRGARQRGSGASTERSPYAWPRRLYLGAALLSMTASPSLLLSSFSLWKLLKMYFLLSVLSVEFAEIEQIRAALIGFGAGVLSDAALVVYQRYIAGYIRVTGSFPHPNSLGMVVNLVTPISLALLLAGKSRRLNSAVVAAGAVCVLMSLSRGGILMCATASALVVAGSLLRDFKPQKLAVIGSLMAGALLLLFKSLDTILDRFANAPKSSEEARVLFNRAAEAMANEHSLGVGLNMFSQVLDVAGYADRFELPPIDRNGVAHHIYWLTAAELGYIGLAAYVVLLAAVLVTAFKAARAPGARGDIGLGITAGLVVMYIQGTAEWIARQAQMSYAFWMVAAMAAAIVAPRKIANR
jgi:hypothetical protein